MAQGGLVLTPILEIPGYALLAQSFYFSFRFLRFPDLTTAATFLTGGAFAALSAQETFSIESSPWTFMSGIAMSVFFGVLWGMGACGIYLVAAKEYFKLLSGVILMYSLWAANVHLLHGQTEMATNNYSSSLTRPTDIQVPMSGAPPTVFNYLAGRDLHWGAAVAESGETQMRVASIEGFFSSESVTFLQPCNLAIGLLMVIGVSLVTWWALARTNLGLLWRTFGPRPILFSTVGRRWTLLLVGLGLTNAIAALGGWYHASVNGMVNANESQHMIFALVGALLGHMMISERRTDQLRLGALVLAPVVGTLTVQVLKLGVLTFIRTTTRTAEVFICAAVVIVALGFRMAARRKRVANVVDDEFVD